MTIRQQGGIFGRNPTFNNVTVDGILTVDQIVEKTGAAGITLDGVTLKDGNVVLVNGNGIDFSATAGTGTSELFDDYEEGTWTPEVADAQTGGNTASGTFTGYYTKIGRMVNLVCILDNIDTTGMTGGNALYVRNLPFAPADLAAAQRFLSNVMFLNVAFNTSAIVTAEIPDAFTYARIAECTSAGGRSFITVSALTSGSADINLQFNYYT